MTRLEQKHIYNLQALWHQKFYGEEILTFGGYEKLRGNMILIFPAWHVDIVCHFGSYPLIMSEFDLLFLIIL